MSAVALWEFKPIAPLYFGAMMSAMSRRKILFILAVAAFASGPHGRADEAIRVACVGDSITFGVGTDNRKTESYPARLQSLLGDQWVVRNYGVSGRTMLLKAHALDPLGTLLFKPHVVVIALGTNDSKSPIWREHPEDFVGDYVAMNKKFQALPDPPRIFACLPPPAFPGDWNITQDSVHDNVIPAMRKAARETGVRIIDLNTPLPSSADLFPDTVHPNREGALRIAEMVAVAIQSQ